MLLIFSSSCILQCHHYIQILVTLFSNLFYFIYVFFLLVSEQTMKIWKKLNCNLVMHDTFNLIACRQQFFRGSKILCVCVKWTRRSIKKYTGKKMKIYKLDFFFIICAFELWRAKICRLALIQSDFRRCSVRWW